jgi:hypothetical protein
MELYLGKKKTFRLEAAIIEISAKSKYLASAVVLVPQNGSSPYFPRFLPQSWMKHYFLEHEGVARLWLAQ